MPQLLKQLISFNSMTWIESEFIISQLAFVVVIQKTGDGMHRPLQAMSSEQSWIQMKWDICCHCCSLVKTLCAVFHYYMDRSIVHRSRSSQYTSVNHWMITHLLQGMARESKGHHLTDGWVDFSPPTLTHCISMCANRQWNHDPWPTTQPSFMRASPGRVSPQPGNALPFSHLPWRWCCTFWKPTWDNPRSQKKLPRAFTQCAADSAMRCGYTP